MTRLPSASPSGGRAAFAAATPAGFIGRYQILEKIGEGGMGSLYLARDPAIDRLIALKVLRRGFDTVELRERFAREARAAGRLRHPNIVTIFDVGEHAGDPFIAMEFLAGETLDELSRHGARLSLVRRLTLIEELCEGLAYAHRAGIVHRDIKPANLMVDSEGVLKILDFGIVRLDDGRVTQSGMLVGTVNYMSPEQVTGSDVDHRSDIFAVGLVAYELISARQAFPGTLKDGLFNRILNLDFEPLSKVAPELDPEAAAIIEQALRKDPAERYQDLARMRNDLQRVRRRLEADEDRVVKQLSADSGETLMATSPVPTPATGTPPKSSPGLEAAERALASGDFRAALTLAGRSAAAEPRNKAASAVMARAQAGLLERGRSLESSASIERPATGGPVASGAVTPSGSMPTAHLPVAMIVAAVVLAVGLVVAAMLLSKGGGGEAAPPQTDAAGAPPSIPAAATNSPSAGSPSGPPAAATEPPASPPASVEPKKSAEESREVRGGGQPRRDPPAQPRERTPARERTEPVAPPPSPPAVMHVGRDGITKPTRTRFVPPEYPAAGPRQKEAVTVAVELTVGRDGRVADAKVIGDVAEPFEQAALAAVRRWEYVPTRVDDKPVAVVFPENVVLTPPELANPAPAELAPPAPPPLTPPSKEPARQPQAQAPPKQPAPSRDENAAIRSMLRQYEAAWEARDAGAIARLHQLSGSDLSSVRGTLANAQRYEMDIAVRSVKIDPGGQKATVVCDVTRAFDPRIGDTVRVPATANTIELEKRGDNWVITAIHR